MNLGRLQRIFGLLEREYNGEETLAERIKTARDYVDSKSHRADVVAELPESAPAGYLLVTPSDTVNVYVGTGAGRPLRKIPTQPL